MTVTSTLYTIFEFYARRFYEKISILLFFLMKIYNKIVQITIFDQRIFFYIFITYNTI